jgi:hypothetical protein
MLLRRRVQSRAVLKRLEDLIKSCILENFLFLLIYFFCFSWSLRTSDILLVIGVRLSTSDAFSLEVL